MARTIKVDPARLESAAQKIDGQVADYVKLYNQLFNEVDGMGAAWKGLDNQTFVNHIKEFQDDFLHMKTVMDKYSEFLKLSAKEYNRTQNDIITQAKRLAN